MNNQLLPLKNCKPWIEGLSIQQEVLKEFYSRCKEILINSCQLKPFDENSLKMEKNLFSTLFLAITSTLGFDNEKIKFYGLVNHCLRTLVTGCDNILDDEYKEVIPFNLKGDGIKFRSVLMIMVADRILANLANEQLEMGNLTLTKSKLLSSSVLSALIPSGLEEHEEESGLINEVATKEKMLINVLYRKTGQLFESPIRVIEMMGDIEKEKSDFICETLRLFGIGCQLLDEIKDVEEDLAAKGHNMVVSIAYYGKNKKERELIRQILSKKNIQLEQIKGTSKLLVNAKSDCFKLAAKHFIQARNRFVTIIPQFGNKEIISLAHFIKKIILKDEDIKVKIF